MSFIDFLARLFGGSAKARTKRGEFKYTGPTIRFANPMQIRYRNAQGQEKTFIADRDSFRRAQAHYSVCVQPSGARITLDPKKILNRMEVGTPREGQAAGSDAPSGSEQWILRYHARRGSTSERYKTLCAKYPNFKA